MLSADSHDYINPMDIELEENMDDVLRLKSELILSFCEIVMDGKRNIPAEANSVIDRCLPIIYEKYIKDPKPENMPTLGDLYECLKRQPEPQVRRIVTALECMSPARLTISITIRACSSITGWCALTSRSWATSSSRWQC